MGNESKKRSSDARDSHYVATNTERDTIKFAPQNITNRTASNNPAGNHRNREFDRVKSGGDAEPELIRFAISQNSLGSVLVASSEKGVCAILLGDNAKALIAELRFRFPKAQLGGGNPEFKTSVAKVVRAIETPGSTLDIPLDLRGTAFQQRVWQALREIPMGSTTSYQEIARKIGMSKTAQDVAEACAANALAIVVPCHRVIRSDGSLAGYRWGIKRKRALLQKEQEASPEPGSLFHAAAVAAHSFSDRHRLAPIACPPAL